MLAAGAGSSAGPAEAALAPAVQRDADDFSVDRAWVNLEAITARGPRAAGAPAADAARTYLRNRLQASGIQLAELELDVEVARAAPAPAASGTAARSRTATSLLGRLKGESDDLLLVAAPYTSPEDAGGPVAGADAGASGAAVVLELARALAEGERRYSYLFVFIAGDGVEPDPVAGSRELAAELARRGILERVRAGLYLDRVGRPQLRIARDLESSAPYRELVWEAARASGHAEAFADEGFDAPGGGHSALRAAGLRQLVALVDTPSPSQASRPPATGTGDCAPASLDLVGTVALASLRRIEDRLAQIDDYAAAPAAATRRSEAAASDTPSGGSSPAAGDAAR